MDWSSATDEQVTEMFHRPMSYSQIAAEFKGANRNKVAGRCNRLGLVREGGRINAAPVVISAEERAERELDQRDLDILYDIQEGHSRNDCAKHYGVSTTRVRKLVVAWRTA